MNADSLKESDVIEWMKSLVESSGLQGMHLQVSLSGGDGGCHFTASAPDCYGYQKFGVGATFHEAIDKVKSKMPTEEQKIDQIKQDIKRLLGEAAASDFAARQEELRTEAKRHQSKPAIHE